MTTADIQKYLADSGLSEQLEAVLARILEDKPRDPVAAFQFVIDLLKAEQQAGQAASAVRIVPATTANPYTLPSTNIKLTRYDNKTIASHEKDVEVGKAFAKMCYPPPTPAAEEGEEPTPYAPTNTEFEMPDFFRDMEALRKFGVNMSLQQVMTLSVSVQRLCEQQPIKSVRFFGVIHGVKASYYVLETVFQDDQRPRLDKKPEGEEDGEAAAAEEEEGGEHGENKNSDVAPPEVWEKIQQVRVPKEEDAGTNAYCYYVSTCLEAGQWTLLPDVTPAQVQAARSTQKYLTGDLDAPVQCHPPFPDQGVEKHYLRAQIARIAASTLVAPKGLATVPEDDEQDEEAKKPGPVKELKPVEVTSDFAAEYTKMGDLSNWVHLEPHISQLQGRCTLWKAEEPESEDAEEEDESKPKKPLSPEELEVCPKQMTALVADRSLSTAHGHVEMPVQAWSLRRHSPLSTKEHPLLSSYCVRSNRWPGAMSVLYPLGWGPAPEEEEEEGKPKPQRPTKYRLVNMYVGYGLKQKEERYGPSMPGPFASECAVTEEFQADVTADMLDKYKEPEPVEEPEADADGEAAEGEDGAEGGEEEAQDE